MADFDTKPFFAGIGKGAARFQGNRGLILVVTDLDVRGALRNPDGTFTAFQGNVLKANQRLVVELAESVAKAAKASQVRPGVSSGRLQSALLDRRNRFASKEGYGVGKPEFLDQSQAKYYRQIDQGYSGHVGREIRGLFGSSLTGEFGGFSPFGPYPIAGPVFTGIGAKGQRGGRLLPFGYSKKRKGLGKERSARGRIDKAIAAQRFFARGWEDFNARARTTEVVKEELALAFGNRGVPTRALIASARQGPRGPRPPSPGKRFT